MDIGIFLRGLIFGLSIAAPVGPVGIVCIRRTLGEGFFYGAAAGLGAATADVFFASVGAFGLTVIANALVSLQAPLRFFGGAFLIYLGWTFFRTPPVDTNAAGTSSLAGEDNARRGLFGAYSTTFFLTITNPITILIYTAMFAGFGSTGEGGIWAALMMVVGVAMGSGGWYLALAGIVSLLKTRMNRTVLLWINRLSGIAIALFGIVVLISALRG